VNFHLKDDLGVSGITRTVWRTDARESANIIQGLPFTTHSVKLHLKDKRPNGWMDKETRLFVGCVCQGRPSYGGNEPRRFI